LFFGSDKECLSLAQRVLNSPMRALAEHNVEFRFGLNAVGEQTRTYVRGAVKESFPDALVIDSPTNLFKYPMMRRLLHEKPLAAPLTMWFDDDSCLAPTCNVSTWLPRLKKQLEVYTMLGSVYRQRLLGNQAAWIKNQWWYNNRPITDYVKFVTGGWWTIQSSVLLRYDWPLLDLKHRGGDVMLGALCAQQDLAIGHFRDHVWINANEHGVESKAPRRGHNERPIGVDYRPGAYEPLSRQRLLDHGACCGSICHNCPYYPPHVRGSTKVHET
jgi:hypothetical protein